MASLGQRLRDERLRQHKELRPIADELRIGSRYLEAIEADDWSKLPGGIFNRSFVRQYAQALGLNGQKFESEYAAVLQPESVVDLEAIGANRDPKAQQLEERKLISIAPVIERSNSFFDGRTGLAVAALVIVVAGGGLLSLLWDNVRSTDKPQTMTAPAPQPAVPAQPRPETKEKEPSAVVQTTPTVPVVIPITTQDGMMSLNIAATEKTWIEVTADGKRIFMGVLEPGQSQRVNTTESARMVVGNAGGVTVQKAGRDIGPIGPRGQVRVVRLTRDQVEIMEPNRSAAPAKVPGD
jgi:cytoskeleton protein RodZ